MMLIPPTPLASTRHRDTCGSDRVPNTQSRFDLRHGAPEQVNVPLAPKPPPPGVTGGLLPK